MANHAYFGTSTSRSSRYYIDPTVKNGECKTLKPADPLKVEALKKLRLTRKYYHQPGAGNNYLGKMKAQNNLADHLRKYSPSL